MVTALVHFKVKESEVDNFIRYTRYNVENSLKEPGIRRFEFYREQDNPARFYLFEIFNSKEDQAKHRETDHYKTWKQNITGILEEPYAGKLVEQVE